MIPKLIKISHRFPQRDRVFFAFATMFFGSCPRNEPRAFARNSLERSKPRRSNRSLEQLRQDVWRWLVAGDAVKDRDAMSLLSK